MQCRERWTGVLPQDADGNGDNKMMDIDVICVGKLKEKYWREALAEYEKRLSAYCRFSVTELKESRSDDAGEEGAEILKRLEDDRYVIALEISGKELSSEKLAEKISALALEGRSRLSFVIGGSEGLSAGVLQRADYRLSFGPMTFPHQMMRIILAEQVYRSFKIIRHEKYHK